MVILGFSVDTEFIGYIWNYIKMKYTNIYEASETTFGCKMDNKIVKQWNNIQLWKIREILHVAT